jgi:hypothetical protein
MRFNAEWTGPLTGDKTWTALFYNSKIKEAVGQFTCSQDLDEILAEPFSFAKKSLPLNLEGSTSHKVAQEEEALMDRIIADQSPPGEP